MWRTNFDAHLERKIWTRNNLGIFRNFDLGLKSLKKWFRSDTNFDIEFIEFANYLPWQQLSNGTWAGALGHLKAGRVDTLSDRAVLTTERINSFEYSIPTGYTNYAALYAAKLSNRITFMNLTASISYQWYLLFLTATICFTILLALLQYIIPQFSINFSWFKTITATIPCFRNQTAALEHLNSVTRIVVFTEVSAWQFHLMSVFYLLCKTEAILAGEESPI